MKSQSKNKLATLIMILFSHYDDHEQYIGDIEELYNLHKQRRGTSRANIYLLKQILRSIPFFVYSSIYWGVIMLRNNFKILFRSMIREKVYSLTNIAGLTIGMICSFMILAYVFHELSYDKFYNNVDRIYRLESEFNMGQQQGRIATSNYASGFFLKENHEEVEDVVHFRKAGDNLSIGFDDKQFFERAVYYSGNSVFNVFSLELIIGDKQTALATTNSVILSESTANKYFGHENPVGKILKIGNAEEYKVTGVFRDQPSNTHLNFDILLSIETLLKEVPARRTVWMGEHVDYANYTFLLMKENADIKNLESKLPGYVDQFMGQILNIVGGEFKLFLFPYKDIYLYSQTNGEQFATGNITYIYIFAGIALLIVIIAAMNFINLSTAKYIKRAREVGLRKIFGSTRRSIVKQFLSESIVYCMISYVLSIISVLLLLPWYSSLINVNVEFTSTFFFEFLTYAFIISLVIGLLSGFYPAIFLSSFTPSDTIKGNMANVNKVNGRLRYVLVVFQFTVSIALIIGTIVIYRQVDYMKNKNLGFHKEQIIVLQISDESLLNSTEAIKNELLSNPKIKDAGFSSYVPGVGAFYNMFMFADNDYKKAKLFAKWEVDADYFKTMGIEMTEGRGFSLEHSTDIIQSVIINEKAIKDYELENSVGSMITELTAQPQPLKIIGVAKDFHYLSVQGEILPMVIGNNSKFFKFLSLRLDSDNLDNTLAFIEDIWTSHNHSKKFEYYFLDEAFNKLYEREVEINNLLFHFTLLAIIIACLGMAGLTVFTSEQRIKEIGVRKVLGASVKDLVTILTKQFIKWVLLANIFAWPIAYYVMERWLENYPYRIDIGISTFILSSMIALIIALVTVGYQTLKTALANPVNALKYE